MLIGFFLRLKEAKIPVSLNEFLTLHAALQQRISFGSVEEFYYLARLCLVKDESNYDRFDRVFASYFQGVASLLEMVEGEIPEHWLRLLTQRHLTEEEKREIQALGGLDRLLETLKQRLEEQKDRHQEGGKWIGTGGTSPFGAQGFNPEGIRIGQEKSRHRRAVKVWEKRDFKDLDASAELGTRNLKVALRRLRHFAREGAEEELDLSGTIGATARNAGFLDLKMVPQRHNKVKVLLFLDVGGSMDDHVELCAQLFSAARTEFKHLEYFYFHNFIYERVWRDNRRRWDLQHPTEAVIRHFGPDYKVIIVGDASMSMYEILTAGGSVEHLNPEPGSAWLGRLLGHYRKAVWINPVPQREWGHTESISVTAKLMQGRMYPLTPEGLDRAMQFLNS
ncbi:vWA domain-containing protein [Geomesophilobacter sediminis]|uniref:VWA domain-containing protein n=1 Tax=Geomesophilobacter sediminis TaxID=2798584 RepID=A0A8J7M2I4_9BACT|nr:VWA domain-containing protein [Geomesophilobacter sediminis]MBJ6727113.1 VWA domain-containing protein [Geomesophilobacter sediminis]